MAGGTHVFDMIKRLRINDDLINRNYFKRTRDEYRRTSEAKRLDFKTATESELKEIRILVLKERKRQTIKAIVTLFVSVLVTGLIIIYVLNRF